MLYPIQNIEQALDQLPKQVPNASPSERRSWANKRDWLIKLSNLPLLKHAMIQLERILPGSNKQRTDILIWLKFQRQFVCIIIEDKQWQLKHMHYDPMIQAYRSKRDRKWRIHPAQQVYSYQKHWEFSELNEYFPVTYIPLMHLINVTNESELKQFQSHHERSSDVHWSRKHTLLEKIQDLISPYGTSLRIYPHEQHRIVQPHHRSHKPIPVPNMKDYLLPDQAILCAQIEAEILKRKKIKKAYVPILMRRSWGGGKSFMAVHLYNQLKNHFVSKLISGSDTYVKHLQQTHLAGIYDTLHHLEQAVEQCELIILDDAVRIMTDDAQKYRLLLNLFLRKGGILILFGDPDQTNRPINPKWEKELFSNVYFIKKMKNLTPTRNTIQQFRTSLDWNAILSKIWGESETLSAYDQKSIFLTNNFRTAWQMYQSHRSGSQDAVIQAPYAYPWNSRTNPQESDIVIDAYEFQWASSQDSVLHPDQHVAHAHRVTGLSFDHGLYIWKWLIVRNGVWQINSTDPCYHKQFQCNQSQQLDPNLTQLIVAHVEYMLTKIVKTCVIYVEDTETLEYLMQKMYWNE